MKKFVNTYEQVWSKGFNLQDTVNRYDFTIQSLTHGICCLLVLFVCSQVPILRNKWIYLVTGIIFVIPYISLFIRRLNDLEKGNFYIFLLLVPVVNLFFWLYLMRTEGHGLIEEEDFKVPVTLMILFLVLCVLFFSIMW